MEQKDINEEIDLNQPNEVVEEPKDIEKEMVDEQKDISQNEVVDEQKIQDENEDISQTLNYSQSQLLWMNKQVSNLEREMLLNNTPHNHNSIGNWAKVLLSAMAVFIPGLGQIIGIIIGLVLVSNDTDSDKRSFGAALLTVSVVAFVLSACFWFIFALSFGPQLYY